MVPHHEIAIGVAYFPKKDTPIFDSAAVTVITLAKQLCQRALFYLLSSIYSECQMERTDVGMTRIETLLEPL